MMMMMMMMSRMEMAELEGFLEMMMAMVDRYY
jgi:hypothetical protein